jgi:hypothetical protein
MRVEQAVRLKRDDVMPGSTRQVPSSERGNAVVVQVRLGRPLDDDLRPDPYRIWVQLHVYRPIGYMPLAPEEYQSEVWGPMLRATHPLGLQGDWLGIASLEVVSVDPHHREIEPQKAQRLLENLEVELAGAGYLVTISS